MSNNNTTSLGLKLKKSDPQENEKFSLDSVPIGKLQQILKHFEKIITETEKELQRDDESTDNVSIFLVSTKIGSACYEFELNGGVFGQEVQKYGVRSVVENSLKNNPSKEIRKSLEKTQKVIKALNCDLELYSPGTQENIAPPLYSLTPTQAIKKPPTFDGETYITGRIIRVGGTKSPSVHLQISGEGIVACKCKSRELLTKLASNLYKVVELEGVASWNILNGDMEDFEAKRLAFVKDYNLSETWDRLSEEFGDAFNEIEDLNKYIKNLRSE